MALAVATAAQLQWHAAVLLQPLGFIKPAAGQQEMKLIMLTTLRLGSGRLVATSMIQIFITLTK